MKPKIGDLVIERNIKSLANKLANTDIWGLTTHELACYTLELYKEVDRLKARVEELENSDRQGNCV